MPIIQQWQTLSLPLLNTSKIFILAESTHQNDLLSKLEFYAPNYMPLWKTTNGSELERYSPYLIESASQPEFDSWLFSVKEKIPYTLINTTLTTEQLFKQLRFFTKLSGVQGGKYYLRLGSSPMFHLYVTSVANDSKCIEKLFANGFIKGYLFQDEKSNLLAYYRAFFEKELLDSEKDIYELKGYLAWRNMNNFAVQGV